MEGVQRMGAPSIYANIRIPGSWRARRTPRVHRKWRPHVIAWAGPFAFYRDDRFYELDTWYRARIDKPQLFPDLHVIDPTRISKSFEERMQPLAPKGINIGYKRQASAGGDATKETGREHRQLMESLARKNQLKIDLDMADFDPISVANHFGIFSDLFVPGVYFHNTQDLAVTFSDGEIGGSGDDGRVRFGNCVKTAMAATPPRVTIGRVGRAAEDGEDGSQHPTSNGTAFNTLLMLNLDGDGFAEEKSDDATRQPQPAETAQPSPNEKKSQLVQWLVANIPAEKSADPKMSDGEVLVPYLQPIPFYGTGYHRIVFLLLRHRDKVDFNAYRVSDGSDLLARRFEMNSFVKRFEASVTPSALSFCQMAWDESCDKVLHAMGHKSPRYWYEWNAPLVGEQKEFPLKPMPFNHYLDMFRPPHVVRKQLQREKLEGLVKLPPGTSHLMKPKYPDIFYRDNKRFNMAPWLHKQLIKRNAGTGVYAALYEDYVNPATQHLKALEEEQADEQLSAAVKDVHL